MSELEIMNLVTAIMRENSEAVGFIPDTTILNRYIRKSRYVLQYDERGRVVGYLLHGAIRMGHPTVISQHVIIDDYRLHGYGVQALNEVKRRCESIGASAIHLRVATDLPALLFWQHCDFHKVFECPGGEKRQRTIHGMTFDFPCPLFPDFEVNK